MMAEIYRGSLWQGYCSLAAVLLSHAGPPQRFPALVQEWPCDMWARLLYYKVRSYIYIYMEYLYHIPTFIWDYIWVIHYGNLSHLRFVGCTSWQDCTRRIFLWCWLTALQLCGGWKIAWVNFMITSGGRTTNFPSFWAKTVKSHRTGWKTAGWRGNGIEQLPDFARFHKIGAIDRHRRTDMKHMHRYSKAFCVFIAILFPFIYLGMFWCTNVDRSIEPHVCKCQYSHVQAYIYMYTLHMYLCLYLCIQMLRCRACVCVSGFHARGSCPSLWSYCHWHWWSVSGISWFWKVAMSWWRFVHLESPENHLGVTNIRFDWWIVWCFLFPPYFPLYYQYFDLVSISFAEFVLTTEVISLRTLQPFLLYFDQDDLGKFLEFIRMPLLCKKGSVLARIFACRFACVIVWRHIPNPLSMKTYGMQSRFLLWLRPKANSWLERFWLQLHGWRGTLWFANFFLCVRGKDKSSWRDIHLLSYSARKQKMYSRIAAFWIMLDSLHGHFQGCSTNSSLETAVSKTFNANTSWCGTYWATLLLAALMSSHWRRNFPFPVPWCGVVYGAVGFCPNTGWCKEPWLVSSYIVGVHSMIYHQFSWLVTESLHIYICLY